MSEIQKSGKHLQIIMKSKVEKKGAFYFAYSDSSSKIFIRSLNKEKEIEKIKAKGRMYVQDLLKPKFAYGFIEYKNKKLIFHIRKTSTPLADIRRVLLKELSLHRPLKALRKVIFQVDEKTDDQPKKNSGTQKTVAKRSKNKKKRAKIFPKKQHKQHKKIILLEEEIRYEPTQESWDRLHKLRLDYIKNIAEETPNPFQNETLDRVSSMALQVGSSCAIHALQKQFTEITNKQIALVQELLNIEDMEYQAQRKEELQHEYNLLYQQSQAFEESLKKLYQQIML